MHKFINTFYLKTYMYKFINTFYLKTYSYWDWGWISTACSPHDLPPTAQLHQCLGHTAGEIVAVHRDEQVCEELLAHLQHNLHDNVARLAVRLLPLPTDWTKLLQTRQDHADPVGILDILGLCTAVAEYFRDAWHEAQVEANTLGPALLVTAAHAGEHSVVSVALAVEPHSQPACPAAAAAGPTRVPGHYQVVLLNFCTCTNLLWQF